MLGLSFPLLLAKDCGDERLSTPLAVHYHPYVNDCFLKIFLIYKLSFILHCLSVPIQKIFPNRAYFLQTKGMYVGAWITNQTSFFRSDIGLNFSSMRRLSACSAYRHHRRIFSYKFDNFQPKGIIISAKNTIFFARVFVARYYQIKFSPF